MQEHNQQTQVYATGKKRMCLLYGIIVYSVATIGSLLLLLVGIPK
jgi:hypothetical protein